MRKLQSGQWFAFCYNSYDMEPNDSLLTAQKLDAADPLASFREKFSIADAKLIYLDGNSLGRLPKHTAILLQEAVEKQWGDNLVRGWGENWYTLPKRIGAKIAQLIGAAPEEVVCTDSTSVNLYKLVMAALSLRQDRSVLLTTDDNFPSDIYILQGCAAAAGKTMRVIAPEEIPSAISRDTALVSLSHAAFKSGALYDVEEITTLAHRAGALALWDLSHSVGAVPIALDQWQVDFAVGCTYKYLNGGPGAPAFLYARRALVETVRSPIWGWFGEVSPFQFDLEYHPSAGIERFLAGTPPILSMLAVEAGVDITLAAGMEAIRAKSIRQTGYLIDLASAELEPLGFTSITPRDPQKRGSHVSLRHPHAYRINRALIEEMAVLPDFREPDVIRLGIAPLFTTYEEIWQAVQRIEFVVERKLFEKYPAERLAVT